MAGLNAAVAAAVAGRAAKPVLFALCLLPLGWLVWLAGSGGLGAEPVAEGVRQSGLWALRFLLLALAVTPLRLLTGWSGLARLRRMMGLFAFFYASVHVLAYVGVDQFFDWGAVWLDILKRPYISVGLLAFATLAVLAATSPVAVVRRLGPRRWRALHKGVFVAGAAACLHYVMLVKGWQAPPFVYAALFAALLAMRLAPTGRRAPRPDRRWRTAGS